MEQLKALSELTSADPRWAAWVLMSKTGEARPRMLEDHYALASDLDLPPTVPQDIVDHFQIARHALIYSWFVYPLMAAAQLQACATLEYALRVKLQLPPRKDRKGRERDYYLRELFGIAVDRGLLSDSGFRDVRDGNCCRRDGIVVHLNAYLADVRNHLAHGATHLTPESFRTLRVIRDAIAQLWTSGTQRPDPYQRLAP